MMLGIVETDEYELLCNKREHKGIIEVLQDFFYESPFKAFDVRNNYDCKSWIDISGRFRIEDNSFEKLYIILFIKSNVKKYDKDNKLMDIEYSILFLIINLHLLNNMLKLGIVILHVLIRDIFSFLVFLD